MRKKSLIWVVIITIALSSWLLYRTTSFEYAYIPDEQIIINSNNNFRVEQFKTSQVESSEEQIKLGKEMFFKETFGNEVFFTDILGMFNGPLTFVNVGKAILKLNGEGTTNLQVEAAESFTVGDVTIKKGELMDTGLDVAKGSMTPLGIKMVFDEGRIKAGVTCAACHASVDKQGNVIVGIPNRDVNVGLTLALGTNTASYFSHTEMESLKDYLKKNTHKTYTVNNKKLTFPSTQEFEKFVDSEILKWPRGSNDTTIELENNPVQIPDTFTLGDQPYGWSGQGQIGPFHGLSASINNAHTQNMDPLSQSTLVDPVMDIDTDVYLATLLQNAANPKYKYDIESGILPSEFFKRVDPTPGIEGVLELIRGPSYPKVSYPTSTGLFSSSPGFNAWEQINAMSAYMNSLHPPKTGLKKDSTTFEEGKRVFAKAGCITCHAGQYFTSNRLIKAEEIKTEGSRAKGFKGTEKFFDQQPKLYSIETPVPLPKNPKIEEISLNREEEKELKLGWAHEESNGGYKTISLYGLYWSAPYLHDGGVAVGPKGEPGIVNTLMKGIQPDAKQSLKALLDSRLRKQVIEANASSKKLQTAHVLGEGHEFWVDETTGFTEEEQHALVHYLLRLTD